MTPEQRAKAKLEGKLFGRGDMVTITGGKDGNGDDENFPRAHVNKHGVVKQLDATEMGTPKDPYFTITLDDGACDGFWRDEMDWKSK